VRKVFATQCSWCHAAYGMQADKGPRLAGTLLSGPEIADRIRNGKGDAMPGFRKSLSEAQITALTLYIEGLKPTPP
jgi:mono/diheme cytochrome c family protein